MGHQVAVFHAYDAVVDTALHIVGTSCQEQTGIRGFPLEGYHDAVGIVVPERGVCDVVSFGRCEETHTDAGVEQSVHAFSPQTIILDMCRALGKAPLSDALFRYLEGGVGWPWRQVLVVEDVVDIGIPQFAHIDGYLLLTDNEVGQSGHIDVC